MFENNTGPTDGFLDATTHLYKRSCPSVYPSVPLSVGPSVPCYFKTANMAVFEGIKSSNDIQYNTMSDDGVAASDVLPR